ncbi:uncharacterized protein LOC110980534 isoform X2 [Acanthaster planci]|uniref:Uncharacterized protein LOC110980534 isoform X2 n=1 Tax=Acanthaster planci TaxID=133434 RepID=A0A8B7YIF7_ACAPL|nr:uncharacterized protein LOC110980534 isoform X2 [Acanthaster planci]
MNTFSFSGHFCLVFELLHPKPLHHYFKKIPTGSKKLQLVRKIALQLLQVLGFLRQENVIHADLKPENILCRTGDLSSGVKVIDFGNAIHCVYDELSLYYDDFELQTLLYRAPEVVYGLPFGPEIDMWSLGCILVELYLGEPLFFAVTKEELLQKMIAVLGPLPVQIFQRGKFYSEFEHFIGKPQTKLETQSKLFRRLGELHDYNFGSFILSILQYNPSERISVSDAFLHPFLAPEVAARFLLPPSSNACPSTYKKFNIPASVYTLSPVISSEVATDHLKSVDLLRRGTTSIQAEPIQIRRPKRAVAEVAPFAPKDTQTLHNDLDKVATVAFSNSSATKVASQSHGQYAVEPSLQECIGKQEQPEWCNPSVGLDMKATNQERFGCSSNNKLFGSKSNSIAFTNSRDLQTVLENSPTVEKRYKDGNVNNKTGIELGKINVTVQPSLTSDQKLKDPLVLSNVMSNSPSSKKEIGTLVSHIEKTIKAECQQLEGLTHMPEEARFKHLKEMKMEALKEDLEKSLEPKPESSMWYQLLYHDTENSKTELMDITEPSQNTNHHRTLTKTKAMVLSTSSNPQDVVSDSLNLLTPINYSQSPECSTQELKKDVDEATVHQISKILKRQSQDLSPRNTTLKSEKVSASLGSKKKSPKQDILLAKKSKQQTETTLLSEPMLNASIKNHEIPRHTEISKSCLDEPNLSKDVTINTTTTERKATMDFNPSKSLKLSQRPTFKLNPLSRIRRSKARAQERIKARHDFISQEPFHWWELNSGTQSKEDNHDAAEVIWQRDGNDKGHRAESKEVLPIKLVKDCQPSCQITTSLSCFNIPQKLESKTLSRNTKELKHSKGKLITKDTWKFKNPARSRGGVPQTSLQSQKLKKTLSDADLKSKRVKQNLGNPCSGKLHHHREIKIISQVQDPAEKPRMLQKKKSGVTRNIIPSPAKSGSNHHTDTSEHEVKPKHDVSKSGHSPDKGEISRSKESRRSGVRKKRKLEHPLSNYEDATLTRNVPIKSSPLENASVRITPTIQADSLVEVKNIRPKDDRSGTCQEEQSHQKLNLNPGNESEKDANGPASSSPSNSEEDDEVLLL